MSKRIDLTGRRFGRLVAIKMVGKNKKNSVLWECLCDCGNAHIASQGHLCQKNSRSCGCLRSEIGKKNNRVDISGNRIGRLIAIKRSEDKMDANGWRIFWEFKCDCGRTTIAKVSTVRDNVLRYGTTSCGCYAMANRMIKGTCLKPDDIPLKLARAKMDVNEIRKELNRLRENDSDGHKAELKGKAIAEYTKSAKWR